jgi:membrane associated rhomboid family serine protease
LPEDRYEEVLARYGFVPARLEQLVHPQKVVDVRFPRQPVQHGPLRMQPPPRVIRLKTDRPAIIFSIFSMMFMHGGWWHLIGNMWFLWIFGNNIEDRLGSLLFAFFYLLGGVVAIFCHWAVAAGQDALIPTVGASGAVSAVLGAYAITYPWTHIRTLVFLGIFVTLVDLPALVVLGVWFILQLVEAQGMLQVGGAQKGVAFWAHVGGFVAGWAMMPLMSPKSDERGAELERQLEDLFRQQGQDKEREQEPDRERMPDRDEWTW